MNRRGFIGRLLGGAAAFLGVGKLKVEPIKIAAAGGDIGPLQSIPSVLRISKKLSKVPTDGSIIYPSVLRGAPRLLQHDGEGV